MIRRFHKWWAWWDRRGHRFWQVRTLSGRCLMTLGTNTFHLRIRSDRNKQSYCMYSWNTRHTYRGSQTNTRTVGHMTNTRIVGHMTNTHTCTCTTVCLIKITFCLCIYEETTFTAYTTIHGHFIQNAHAQITTACDHVTDTVLTQPAKLLYYYSLFIIYRLTIFVKMNHTTIIYM